MLERLDDVEGRSSAEAGLKARVSQDLGQLLVSVLKLQLQDLSPDKSWMDYGLDSIASTELATAFTEKFKISLPPTIFFEFQNLATFTEYLATSYGPELENIYRHQPLRLVAAATPGTASADAPEPAPAAPDRAASIEDLWAAAPASPEASFAVSAPMEPAADEIASREPFVAAATVHDFPRPGGGRLECAVYGEGEPVLLLGGLVMHFSVMWRLQLEAWGADRRLIMMHMPGCGGATLYDGVTLDSLADDAAALLDALGVAGPVPVLGYSFGGVLAQAFALRHRARCSRLAICVSASSSEGADDFSTLMRELQKSPRFMELNRGWPMSALPTYGRVATGFDFRARLSALDLPALVVSADRDRYMTSAHAAETAARLPNARTRAFPDAGHLVGFTHHRAFNEAVLEFWREETVPHDGASGTAVYAPASDDTLQALEDYVRAGDQGHAILLSPDVAQAALLLDIGLNAGKPEPQRYRSFFLTSQEEALDAAIRFARHLARNRSGGADGRTVMIDPSGVWERRFNPVGGPAAEALTPGVEIVASLAAARSALAEGAGAAALVFVATQEAQPDDLARFVGLARSCSAAAILVDRDGPGVAPSDWLSFRSATACDIVVLGESVSGAQAPSGAMATRDAIGNPWAMTPNEGYVRHPMANLGFASRAILDHLRRTIAVTDDQARNLRRIRRDPEANHAAHLSHGNGGYARVARMHGFDARFYEGRGSRSRVIPAEGGPSREIVDCLSNVGSCPRGLNPLDVIDAVARGHDRDHDYWGDLRAALCELTGFDDALPAASHVAALDAGVALALAASRGRTKIVAFSGGAAFSLASAAVAHDPLFDSFRAPFQPVYPHVAFIDPGAADAGAKLEAELASGDVALVWLETLQVEGNATRPLPADLVETVERLRGAGGYLVGVDETQTAFWTGRPLHSETLSPRPDIVVLGTAVTDGLLPMGVVLGRSEVFARAETAGGGWLAERRRRACQLSSHLAAHALRDILARDLMREAREQGAYFKAALEDLRARRPIIREIRGEGLLLTIELDLSGFPAFVQQSFGYLLWGSLMRDPEGGVAVVVCPLHNACLRFAPPLTISRTEIDLIIGALDRALAAGPAGVLSGCASYCEQRGDMKTASFLNRLSAESAAKGEASGPAAGTKGRSAGRRDFRVCIIGAGVAGISMAKALKDKNIRFDCYEKREHLGGIWAYDADRKHTSTWANLNMNTPKGHYQFADMPMPQDYPDYPSRQQVQDYLEAYADRNDLREHIHLGCGVRRAERRTDGVWEVTLDDGDTREFDALAVANGHHNQPAVPEFDVSRFTGTVSHSQHYRSRHEYRDQRVMVVGIGNSGSQIAVDVSHDAAMTYLAVRRGVYVLPHYLFGMRIDKALGPLNSWWVKKLLPYPLHEILLTTTYNLFIARHRSLGMPRPDHWMMSCLPTMSENLPNRIGDGKLKIVTGVDRVEGRTVHLAGGDRIEVDAIIYSTGYRTSFPFLDDGVIDASDNTIQLYKRIFHPGIDNIVFIGLFQAITWGFLDIMERQSQLAAQYFSGEYALPSAERQMEDIAAERKRIEREYVPTLRNQYYLHGPTYMRDLSLEMRRGRRRTQGAAERAPLSFLSFAGSR
ncbi:acetylornithine/succinyldiaminopimelate/putrescine aminotransferase/pimeloyl-ACP methyl ester carboxylesterase/acyl carrier protein [Methylopila jiangsuensis]|uniref:aminotransferase class III-fold pyridoxal phosphate-dependent enzyme n=1 Tax=Methylopila jiangsuensis TaxID=586230 RepID=UPI0022F3269C|nr:aminotransferase class III-fold pyridoxal phosphate-dependent enzyme [Methylopila jiangsuensis]MDR6286805.1 acetylornithine/succinyldiaminopimelate/putrescine aminotransferase/pimeloyl-ACP methyl ester carboxylesterase/acyl carrier protein [Methylopila jiangsuensis]